MADATKIQWTDATWNPIVDQIRRAHKSARPKITNPSWINCHHDCGVLLAEIKRLREAERAAYEQNHYTELMQVMNEVRSNGEWTEGEQYGDWKISRAVYDMANDLLDRIAIKAEADMRLRESTALSSIERDQEDG